MQNNFQFLSRLLPLVVVVIVFFWAVFGVVKAETLTNLYKNDLGIDKICQKLNSSTFKFSKIIEFESYKKSAQAYCIFQDSDQNLQVFLTSQNNQWEVLVYDKLNQEGKIYWPIYL